MIIKCPNNKVKGARLSCRPPGERSTQPTEPTGVSPMPWMMVPWCIPNPSPSSPWDIIARSHQIPAAAAGTNPIWSPTITNPIFPPPMPYPIFWPPHIPTCPPGDLVVGGRSFESNAEVVDITQEIGKKLSLIPDDVQQKIYDFCFDEVEILNIPENEDELDNFISSTISELNLKFCNSDQGKEVISVINNPVSRKVAQVVAGVAIGVIIGYGVGAAVEYYHHRM
ncbi:hypothetical protein ACQKM9_18060 [Viridibacillus sp. NPDC093762]|uniref:hypothetical protein n=1 Tax=Viridibacillus sp. NPDC093762 TaxID=3390720 RepID=UPI003CFFDEE6